MDDKMGKCITSTSMSGFFSSHKILYIVGSVCTLCSITHCPTEGTSPFYSELQRKDMLRLSDGDNL